MDNGQLSALPFAEHIWLFHRLIKQNVGFLFSLYQKYLVVFYFF